MKKAGIFLILLAFLCVGQGFGPKIIKGPVPVNISAGGGGDLVTVGNMYYWWIGTNAQVAETTTTVTNWPDTIQQSLWTNANSSIAPTTNGGKGVLFVRTSSQYLTNVSAVIIDLGGTYTMGFIASQSVGSSMYFIGFHATANSPSLFSSSAGLMNYNPGTPVALCTIGSAIVDVLLTFSGSGAGVTMNCYTNGVLSTTESTDSINGFPLRRLGLGASYWNGTLYDLAFWTNVAFNSTQISNFHYYATNTYKYSP